MVKHKFACYYLKKYFIKMLSKVLFLEKKISEKNEKVLQ